MNALQVPVQLCDAEAIVPFYSRIGDAGMDLHANCDVSFEPFERALVPTGLKIAIPPGYAGFILPRSGLALKHGFSLVNAPGLIDSNYRGEIKVIAINLDAKHNYTVHKHDRIAQLVIMRIENVMLIPSFSLDATERGEEGFGSSGISTSLA